MRYFTCLVILSFYSLFGQQSQTATTKYYGGIYTLTEDSQKEYPTFYQFNIESIKGDKGSTRAEIIVIFSSDTVTGVNNSAKLYKVKTFRVSQDSVHFDTGKSSIMRFTFTGAYIKSTQPNNRDIPLLRGELKYYEGTRLVKKGIVEFDGATGC
jgi:hypothetical protein